MDAWYLHETKDYSILFPKKVVIESKVIDADVGKLPLEIGLYDASNETNEDNFIYGLYTTIYPDSLINSAKTDILTKFFRGAIDGAVKNVRGKLLAEKGISINEFPGREIKVDYNEGQAIIMMRCYLVKNVLYIIQTISLTEKTGNASAMKFMNSFKLK